ncbi:hypothetical protein KBI23_03110 [bacterium]|nr:hypothetical protein [bacterium]MBP9807454.1 hypothetical protein [bacterium]
MAIQVKKSPFYELTETAILGTDRKPLNRILAGGDLGKTIADLSEREGQGENQSPERVLIDQLTTLSIARKAGIHANVFENPIAVCPPESQQKVSERSLALLVQILALETKGSELRPSKMVADWLSYCAEANQRVPEEFVPRLLSLGRNISDLHQLIAKCCGEHFAWLISLNQEWRTAYKIQEPDQPDDSDQIQALVNTFETADQKERYQALLTMRQHDAQAALTLLSSIFEKESFDSKILFLKALNISLSLSDEPFLEDVALADRRKEVRAQAAAQLCLIANSRFQQRMIARADQYLAYNKNENRFAITLPDKLEDSMSRDGIIENLSIDSRLGQKATWLCQIVSLVPASHWQKRFALSAKEILKVATANSEWSLALTLALINSAAKFGEVEIQQAILECGEIHLTDSQSGLLLLKALPHALLENLILQKLPSWSRPSEQAPRLDLWYYLEQVDFNWSEQFTREIMKFIIKECREKVPVFGHTFYSNASIFALRMHISAGELIEQIAINSEMTDVYRRNALERMSDTVKLRYEIFQSFKSSKEIITSTKGNRQ